MNQQTALVTGGGSGIGQAIAEALAAAGATVLIADFNEAGGTAVAQAIGGHFIQADLSTRAGCQHVAHTALTQFGHVDILVNNAGFQSVNRIEAFPEDTWDKMIALMLTAPFLLTKYVWPGM
jgi:3-hydroxybutyrate dehydrogenase